MDNWIKVEDKLPELPKDPGWSEYVLAATAKGRVIEARYTNPAIGEPYWDSIHPCHGKNRITHWMPYPAAPSVECVT